MLGNHQVHNASLALAACEILNRKKIDLPVKSIRTGLAEMQWPGRLEVVSWDPFILLDGAHNLTAARNLAKFLINNLANQNITLVIGMLDDKPYKAILRSLVPISNRVILTRPKIDRGLPTQTLNIATKDLAAEVMIIPSVEKAVQYAIDTAGVRDAVCIAGSLYVVGEAKVALKKMGYR